MNKIENAIKEIHNIDYNANKSGFLNNIHPLLKIIITISYIILLTSINKYNLAGTIFASSYLILVSIIRKFVNNKMFKKNKISNCTIYNIRNSKSNFRQNNNSVYWGYSRNNRNYFNDNINIKRSICNYCFLLFNKHNINRKNMLCVKNNTYTKHNDNNNNAYV